MTQVVSPQKLCWNCDGSVDLDSGRCPYCAADLESPVAASEAVAPDLDPPYPTEEVAEPTEKQELAGPETGSDTELLWPMAMLLSGAVFLLFGLALFLHSGQESMVLRWSSGTWPFYVVPSVGLLYFGWKRLPKHQ